jgi:hypothetical protein
MKCEPCIVKQIKIYDIPFISKDLVVQDTPVVMASKKAPGRPTASRAKKHLGLC